MRYLTIAEMLEVAEGHVGDYQFLSEDQLHYLVEAVSAKFGDTELYPTPFQKANAAPNLSFQTTSRNQKHVALIGLNSSFQRFL